MSQKLTTTISVDLFNNAKLNDLAVDLIGLDAELYNATREMQKATEKAFVSRWRYGKLIYDNYDVIIAECGDQKSFAEIMGKNPAMISNNLRGYKALLEYGCFDESSVLSLLDVYNIHPTTRNFEKIGTLLAEPKQSDAPEVKMSKDHRILADLHSQVTEIVERELPKHTDTGELAFELKEHIEKAQEVLQRTEPYFWQWKSRSYLDFVKSRGMDYITGQPAELLDPHHVLPTNRAGGTARKVADMFTIPVTRETHMKLEEGSATEIQILKALVRTMSEFIYINVTPDE